MRSKFKKSISITIILAFSLFFNNCSEKEVLKTVTEVNDNEGLTINKRQKIEKLEEAKIVDKKIVKTTEHNGRKFDSYEIKMEGNQVKELEAGTVIVLDKKVLFITDIKQIAGRSASTNSKVGGVLIKAKEVTLDFLFNYESAKIEFVSNNTRAKKNYKKGLNGKIVKGKIEEIEPISNSTIKIDDKGATIKFLDNKISLEAENKNTKASVNIVTEGALTINPGIDFLMEYNPKFFPIKKDPKFDNFLKEVINFSTSPTSALINKVGATGLTLGTMKQMKGVFYCDIDFAADFSLELEGELENEIFRKKITQIKKVYPLPTPITQVTEFYFEFKTSTKGTLSYNYEKRVETDFVAGFNYKNYDGDKPKIEWTYYSDARETTKSYFEARIELSAELALVAKTELYVLSAIGPSVESSAYTEASINVFSSTKLPTPSWEADLDVGVKVEKGSLDLSLFHWDKTTFSVVSKDNIFEIKKNIYNAPNKVKIIYGNNQEGVIGRMLKDVVKVEVLGSRGDKVLLPTNVFFEGSNKTGFDGVPEKQAVIYNPIKGYAINKWKLGSKEGEQKMLVSLKEANGSITGKTAIVNAIAKKSIKPTLTTNLSTNITSTSFTTGGKIISNSGTTIIEKGIVYSTNPNPSITNGTKKIITSAEANFSIEITGVQASTKYYVKAYATNVAGTGYGNEQIITTKNTQTKTLTPPILLTPKNGATDIENNKGSVLSFSPAKWTNTTTPIAHNLYFGTSSNPPKHQLIPAGVTSPNSLQTQPNTTYYWKIVPVNTTTNQEMQGTEIWSFTTKSTKAGGGTPGEKVFVQGGTFMMGSSVSNSSGYPQHQVTLSDFSIGKYEVTNAEYATFLNSQGNQTEGGTKWLNIDHNYSQIVKVNGTYQAKVGKENYPVILVTWYGAKAYAEWVGGRLPTEAEWEYAARGGSQNNNYTYSGSNTIDNVGWYNGNTNGYTPKTQEVGTKQANELGIHDMSGNVWEWCNDWYGDYSNSPSNNPQGPSNGSYRLLRGGSWGGAADYCHVAYRNINKPNHATYDYGFRVVFP